MLQRGWGGPKKRKVVWGRPPFVFGQRGGGRSKRELGALGIVFSPQLKNSEEVGTPQKGQGGGGKQPRNQEERGRS